MLIEMRKSCYWVYILHCENDSYYTGYTTDIKKRYKSHVTGNGKCKYTRSFKPIRIAQSWEILGNRSLAMKIEYYIKQLPRSGKEALIHHPEILVSVWDGVVAHRK